MKNMLGEIRWVITDMLGEKGFDHLTKALDDTRTPYHLVKYRPFINEIEPDLIFLNEERIIVNGTTGMLDVAKRKGWIVFDEALDYNWYLKGYAHHMLNPDAKAARLRDVVMTEPMFIRPINDSKSFIGQVMTPREFETWREQVRHVEEKYPESRPTVTSTTLVVTATPKKLLAEFRYYIIGGRVVTGSMYKKDDLSCHKEVVASGHDSWDFAQLMAARWHPCQAYVMDIAEIEEGFRVIELGSIHLAGFYDCNMRAVVESVNNLLK